MHACVCVCDLLTLGARNREDLFTTHLGREPAEEETERLDRMETESRGKVYCFLIIIG